MRRFLASSASITALFYTARSIIAPIWVSVGMGALAVGACADEGVILPRIPAARIPLPAR